MMIGKPNMCNGANIAYPKAVFEEVNGFDGNEHIASGDDEFLMHKIAEKYPNQIVFAHYQPNIVLPNHRKTFVLLSNNANDGQANGIIIKIGKLLFWQ
jgi:hypothetical protein